MNNTNSFQNMMNSMGVTFNYSGMPNRYGARSRQGVMGSKKSSLIDSVIGNANKARERAARTHASGNIHTPIPSNTTGFLNDSKLAGEVLRMGANNNHQQAYKLHTTGRGKTPHQKPGSPKRRKHSSSKRSRSRPRSSKHSGHSKVNQFINGMYTGEE
jgi:hypothetical protein